MKKFNLSIFLFLSATISFAQNNVGINTTSPEYTLHVKTTAGESSVGVNAAGTSPQALLNLSIDNRIDGNSLLFLKYRPGVAGTTSGIPKSNLSLISADAGAGPLLISTNQNSHIHFATNNAERMRITNAGHVAINNTNPSLGWLQVESTNNISPISSTNNYTAGAAFAMEGYVSSSVGAGVIGVTTFGGVTSPYTLNSYGVIGTAGAAGIGVGAFSLSGGTALRAEITSGTGTAIHSIGNLKFTGIGEAAGKVLTTDVSGNATWQSLTGTHNHFGESWSGTASSGLAIINNATAFNTAGINSAAAGGGTNLTFGVSGFSNSTNGIGVAGINNSGAYAPSLYNSGVCGSAGTGYGIAGISITGYSVYGLKPSSGSYTGAVARFENQNSANTSSVLEVSGTGSQPVLELNNGFIKVSGTNKTAFTVTAVTGGGGNTSANSTFLNYTGMSSTDIVIVTHNWQGGYIGAVGVYWTGTAWAIFREDLTAMPNGEKFNVMVIKQ